MIFNSPKHLLNLKLLLLILNHKLGGYGIYLSIIIFKLNMINYN